MTTSTDPSTSVALAGLRQAVAAVTPGWTGVRRAQVAAALVRAAATSSPGIMAAALDPRTRQTPALDLIDAALIEAATGGHPRWIINIAPQEGKSSRCARAATLWALTRDQDRRVIIGSYAETLAASHSAWARDRARDNPWTGLALDPSQATRANWRIDGRDGGVRAVGVGGGIAGFPCDWLVIDDPHKGREDADSLTMRNKVWDWWTDDLQTRLSPDAVVIVIQTRWHEDDLTGRLLAEDAVLPVGEREWRVVHIPAVCDQPDTDPLGRELGEPMESVRGPKRAAQWARVREKQARTWAALYQGRPTPREGGIWQWAWITPYRVPRDHGLTLGRVVVGVDPTAGGGDEAGIIAAGRTGDGRTVVLADRSGLCTDLQQWRRAWFLALDVGADELVWEANLVTPMMRRAVKRAWTRVVEQARALADVGVLDEGLDEGDVDDLLAAAAEALVQGADDDVRTSTDPLTAIITQLRETLPYARQVLAAPKDGPARVVEVHATRGKTTRAEPCAAAYEAGTVAHAGVLHALEQEMTTWQEGQASPNRVDALVWAWTRLNLAGPASFQAPSGRLPGVGAQGRV